MSISRSVMLDRCVRMGRVVSYINTRVGVLAWWLGSEMNIHHAYMLKPGKSEWVCVSSSIKISPHLDHTVVKTSAGFFVCAYDPHLDTYKVMWSDAKGVFIDIPNSCSMVMLHAGKAKVVNVLEYSQRRHIRQLPLIANLDVTAIVVTKDTILVSNGQLSKTYDYITRNDLTTRVTTQRIT